MEVRAGRVTGVRARVNGSGLDPRLSYSLEDVNPPNSMTLEASRPDRPTDRLNVTAPGTAKLVITSPGGAVVRVDINAT